MPARPQDERGNLTLKGIPLRRIVPFRPKPDLAKADLILTMDEESEVFVKENLECIRGEIRPFGLFLPPGSPPHLADPFLERKEHHEGHYAELIYLIEEGCEKLVETIATLTD